MSQVHFKQEYLCRREQVLSAQKPSIVASYFHNLFSYAAVCFYPKNLICDCEAFSFCSEACHSFC